MTARDRWRRPRYPLTLVWPLILAWALALAAILGLILLPAGDLRP